MNQCLRGDREARRRQLYVRTFSAIPLADTCGLIEFVPNLVSMRSALKQVMLDEYPLRGLKAPLTENECYQKRMTALDTKTNTFNDAKLLHVLKVCTCLLLLMYTYNTIQCNVRTYCTHCIHQCYQCGNGVHLWTHAVGGQHVCVTHAAQPL